MSGVGVGVGVMDTAEYSRIGDCLSVNEVGMDTDLSDTESEYDLSSLTSGSTGGEVPDLEFSDFESIYGYPYDLQQMQSSSPLRVTISINGKSIEALFDSGSSVSILGSSILLH